MVRKIEGPRVPLTQPTPKDPATPGAPASSAKAAGDAFEKATVGSLADKLGMGLPSLAEAGGPKRVSPRGVFASVTPLDPASAARIAAANIARAADSLREAGGSLRDLMGGEAAGLLDRHGLLGGGADRTVGRQPPPGDASRGLGLEGQGGLLDPGIPRRRGGPFDAALRAPDPRGAMAGAAGMGTIVPGTFRAADPPPPGWSGGGTTYLRTDGVQVTDSVLVDPDGNVHTIHVEHGPYDSVRDRTTVIVTPDGKAATIRDHQENGGPVESTAEGDPGVIAREQERREEAARQQDLAETQDPDAPGSNPWGWYDPLTGQYWGPKPFDPTQGNPGREGSVAPSGGPRLAIDPEDLASQPLAHESRGPARPKLTSPEVGIGPDGRPAPPGTPGEEP